MQLRKLLSVEAFPEGKDEAKCYFCGRKSTEDRPLYLCTALCRPEWIACKPCVQDQRLYPSHPKGLCSDSMKEAVNVV